MTVRFGLLGAGRIGKVHAKAITSSPKAKLVAVADAFEKAASDLAGQYGCQIRTIEQILASDDIDAVVICTPTDTHADLIEQFSRAGKAIFCEKPIDLDVERVKACLKVVDAEGNTVPRGEIGELCTRGYSVMLGYWNNPKATAESIDAEGWMHTGDLAVMDEQGYVRIVGRSKDMIIRGGENIYPRELEEFFFTHPAVADV